MCPLARFFEANASPIRAMQRARFSGPRAPSCTSYVPCGRDRDIRAVKEKVKSNAISRGVRLNRQLMDRVMRAAADGGFSNASAFIRAAVEHELAGRDSGVESAEARIAASLDRLLRELRGLKLAQQALFAFTDALAKTLLTCLAEPPRDAYDQAIARGRLRYDRFLKSVGAGIAGDSKAAMTELVQRVEEN